MFFSLTVKARATPERLTDSLKELWTLVTCGTLLWQLKNGLLKESEMGSEAINHVHSLFNRSKEYWSPYIPVRSLEEKMEQNPKTGRKRWGVKRQIMQGGSPERLGAFQHPVLSCTGCCWVVTQEIQPGSTNPAVLCTACAQDARTVLDVWFNITISYSLDRKGTAW